MLDADDEVRLANPAAHRWLDELGAGDRRAPDCRWWSPPSPARPAPSIRPGPGRGRAPGPAAG